MPFTNDDHHLPRPANTPAFSFFDTRPPRGAAKRQPSPENEVLIPVSALCLKVPGTQGEELVVHREGCDDYVFLFEALDDATDYARAAESALGFSPEIGRVRVAELHFRTARYKPAVGDQIDVTLRGAQSGW